MNKRLLRIVLTGGKKCLLRIVPELFTEELEEIAEFGTGDVDNLRCLLEDKEEDVGSDDSQGRRHIDDEILKKVILDEHGNAYRIIPMELEFLRKYELPLPRKHWLDRMKENFRIN